MARFGDLLPLPVPKPWWSSGDEARSGSRRGAQRVRRRADLLEESQRTVRALNQLGGYDLEEDWPVRPLSRAQDATGLESLLEGEDLLALNEFEQKMKLSDEEAGGVQEDALLPKAYMDPVLAKHRSLYLVFLESMVKAGVLGFTRTPRMRVGIFFVEKQEPSASA